MVQIANALAVSEVANMKTISYTFLIKNTS